MPTKTVQNGVASENLVELKLKFKIKHITFIHFDVVSNQLKK